MLASSVESWMVSLSGGGERDCCLYDSSLTKIPGEQIAMTGYEMLLWGSVGLLVLALLLGLVSPNSQAKRMSLRYARVPSGDSLFENAYSNVARIVASDIGVPADKLRPEDTLSSLGYAYDSFQPHDLAEDIIEIISEETGLPTQTFCGCITLGEIAKRICCSKQIP